MVFLVVTRTEETCTEPRRLPQPETLVPHGNRGPAAFQAHDQGVELGHGTEGVCLSAAESLQRSFSQPEFQEGVEGGNQESKGIARVR